MNQQESQFMQARLQRHVDQLMEFFDCVQIIVSGKDHGDWKWGAGNWNARLGLCRDLVTEHDERVKQRAYPDEFPPEDDEEDDQEPVAP